MGKEVRTWPTTTTCVTMCGVCWPNATKSKRSATGRPRLKRLGTFADLILSDVMMPGLDGFSLLQALRNDPELRDVPVILLSAVAGGSESRRAGRGCQRLCHEPVQRARAAPPVSRHISTWRHCARKRCASRTN